MLKEYLENVYDMLSKMFYSGENIRSWESGWVMSPPQGGRSFLSRLTRRGMISCCTVLRPVKYALTSHPDEEPVPNTSADPMLQSIDVVDGM